MVVGRDLGANEDCRSRCQGNECDGAEDRRSNFFSSETVYRKDTQYSDATERVWFSSRKSCRGWNPADFQSSMARLKPCFDTDQTASAL